MIKGFQEIQDEFRSYDRNVQCTNEELTNFQNNSVVVLTVGGLGQRTSEVKGMQEINKNAYELSNGKSIVEMSIELFRKSGYKHFVALVFHKAETIIEELGDGSRFNVNIKYSYDPEHPVGRGGAILNALVNGTIERTKNLIVYNPSDVILNYNGDFANDIVKAHVSNMKKGVIATMRLEDSIVTDLEFHPMVPIPAHMGVSILAPEVFPYLDRYIDISKKCDFEKVIFPILAEEGKMGATEIPQECWFPVKDAKTLEKLEEALKARL